MLWEIIESMFKSILNILEEALGIISYSLAVIFMLIDVLTQTEINFWLHAITSIVGVGYICTKIRSEYIKQKILKKELKNKE